MWVHMTYKPELVSVLQAGSSTISRSRFRSLFIIVRELFSKWMKRLKRYNMTWTGYAMVVALLLSASHHNAFGNSRQRKDMINFLTIAALKTGRNPLDFINYGRYCGLGGSGYALDETDNCCKLHDECYTQVKNTHECSNLSDGFYYFLGYSWEKSEDGDVRCVAANDTALGLCSADLCQCDVDIVHCIASTPYNSANHKTMLWRILESFLSNTVEFISNILFPFF
ncbi:hypothetical protein CHUAL_005105 [Chamberlinius hualienensis]